MTLDNFVHLDSVGHFMVEVSTGHDLSTEEVSTDPDLSMEVFIDPDHTLEASTDPDHTMVSMVKQIGNLKGLNYK